MTWAFEPSPAEEERVPGRLVARTVITSHPANETLDNDEGSCSLLLWLPPLLIILTFRRMYRQAYFCAFEHALGFQCAHMRIHGPALFDPLLLLFWTVVILTP